MEVKRILTGLLVFVGVFAITLSFGALHNQVSYTFSPDMFYRVWFEEFGFVEYGRDTPRLTAAIIGAWSTLGVGLIFALFYLLVVLIAKPPIKYIFRAIALQIGITVLIGFIGFAVGFLFLSPERFAFEISLAGITHPRSFMGAYIMHTASYVGAFFGLGVAILYLVRKRKAQTV